MMTRRFTLLTALFAILVALAQAGTRPEDSKWLEAKAKEDGVVATGTGLLYKGSLLGTRGGVRRLDPQLLQKVYSPTSSNSFSFGPHLLQSSARGQERPPPSTHLAIAIMPGLSSTELNSTAVTREDNLSRLRPIKSSRDGLKRCS